MSLRKNWSDKNRSSDCGYTKSASGVYVSKTSSEICAIGAMDKLAAIFGEVYAAVLQKENQVKNTRMIHVAACIGLITLFIDFIIRAGILLREHAGLYNFAVMMIEIYVILLLFKYLAETSEMTSMGKPEDIANIRHQIYAITYALFDIASYVSVGDRISPPSSWEQRLTSELKAIEGWTSEIDHRNPRVSNFVLPLYHDGCFNKARAEVRAIERALLSYINMRDSSVSTMDTVNTNRIIIKYVNRLSDYLYCLQRYMYYFEDSRNREIIYDINNPPSVYAWV